MSDEKETAFYSAKVNAWFNTKLEYDKSLLVLSAGAIGLLVTLLSSVGVKTIPLLFLFGIALFCFIICLGCVLAIFLQNARHLEDLISGKETNDPVLKALDSLSIFSFIIGVILSSIIGLGTAVNEIHTEETIMSDKIKPKKRQTTFNQDSFNGANRIAPQSSEAIHESFNGAKSLSPSNTMQGKENNSTSNTSASKSSSSGSSNKSSQSSPKP
jgi:hypothetical protein